MNIMDFSPKDFEAALKELGLQKDQEDFVRNEYSERNTVAGQMKGAFQAATDTPDGRVRSEVLPMTKPEGMSGWDAIRSGEAQLALPGIVTGTAEEALRSVETGEKASMGLQVPQEDLESAAMMGSGLSFSGAATRLGSPVDRTVVSSGGAGPKTPYKPSLFRRADEAIPVSGNFEVATFYSPTVETLRNTDFPSKGMTGGDLLKLLQDKTPGIRKAELDALDLGIDKSKRYTKEEILGLAEKKSYRVTASVESSNQYRTTQRQKLTDLPVGYDELKINAVPNDPEAPAFLPSRGYTHYDPETIAHTRISIRESTKDGTEYALIEEIQSDLLQKGAIKPRKEISVDQAYDEVFEFVAKDMLEAYPDAKPLFNADPERFKDWFKIAAEQNRGDSADPAVLERLIERARARPSIEELAQQTGVNPLIAEAFQNTFEGAGWPEGARIDRRTKAVGASPLSDDADAVRFALQAALAKADDAEVSSLVIPNIQRIVAERAKPGTEEYENFVSPKSGFTRTYVKGVEKFIKRLQDEFGDAIKVEQVELPYQTRSELPSTAIKIDFSELRKRRTVDFRVGSFAEGGMVEMDKLFQEGGMTDDGMSREPVTGNEVPPGSLAKEVRDDIPARLSEGEYVIPADVVRFFGVKFFEDLRMQAKKGLSDMDKDGRIGGTPAAPEGEDEALTPEEEQMLREALGGGELQMAEGGVVQPFDRTQFTVGNTSGFQTRKYINPKTKEERSFSFINGMPLGSVPEGFIPYTEEAAKVEDVKPSEGAPSVTPAQDGGEGRDMADANKDNSQSGYAGWAEANRDAIMADPLGFGLSALEGLEGRSSKGIGAAIGGGLGGLPGAMLGGAVDLARMGNVISDARAALSQLDPTSQAYKDLDSKIKETISSLPTAQKTAINMGVVATGKAKINALNDVLTGGNFEYDYAKDITPATRAVTQGFAPPPSRPGSFSSAPPSRPSSPSGTPSGGAPSAGPSASASGPSRSGDDRSAGGFGVDARAEGGLMMKPKKAKAKSKGLAGKQ
jgi:hypothetical protein